MIERVHWDSSVYTRDEILEIMEQVEAQQRPVVVQEDPPTQQWGTGFRRQCPSCDFLMGSTEPRISGYHLCLRENELFYVSWAVS